MVLKMKLVSISGKLDRFDEALEKYIMGYDAEMENPSAVLKNASGFVPHMEANPYDAVMKRFESVFDYVGLEYNKIKRHKGSITKDELGTFIDSFDRQMHALKDGVHSLDEEKERLVSTVNALMPIIDADIRIEHMSDFKFMSFRFGRLPLESFNKAELFLKAIPAYFSGIKTDKNYIWGFYFTPKELSDKADQIMAALYFERFLFDSENEGTPKEIALRAENRIAEIDEEKSLLNKKMNRIIEIQKEELFEAFSSVKFYYDLNCLKKYAAYTGDEFYMTFWTDAKTAEALIKLSEADAVVTVSAEDADKSGLKVPTKLKNTVFVRPFEEFVRMYGIPRYNEIDPTAFLAVMYSVLFGMMFGDVGHGLCLFAAGVGMTVLKKGGFLGRILIPVGITSTAFGFLYGTFFGFEGHNAVIKPIWFTPMEDMMRILLTTVAIGVGILLLCMAFNVINGIRQRNRQKILFSHNGISGIVLYVLVIYTVLSAAMGSKRPVPWVTAGIILSLALIFLSEPLGKLAAGCKEWLPKDKGGFLVQSFFELFEIALSFVTNTMSFVRVGAFALNHAGMMSVVLMFMRSMNPAGSVAVAVFGNLLVMGLEGLIVGIQVLRLGFYEMFSRFYDGDGREFKPTLI